jgi:hypothetical protein
VRVRVRAVYTCEQVPVDGRVQDHVAWGELGPSLLADIREMITSVALPLVDREASWGRSSRAGRGAFHQAVERFLSTLPSTSVRECYRPLATPDRAHLERLYEANISGEAAKGLATVFAPLVVQWVAVVHAVLQEAEAAYPEPDDGPAAVRTFWDRRHSKLKAIEFQVRAGRVQAVVSVLIAAQSKVIRQWRAAERAVSSPDSIT